MYSATVGSFKKAITESLPIIDITVAIVDSTNNVSIFHKYQDFTDIAALDIGYNIGAAIATATVIDIYKDGTKIYTDSIAGGSSKNNFTTMAIPPVNRVYGLLEIKLSNASALGTLLNCKGYARG